MTISHLRNENQSHGEITAEEVGESDKSKGGVFLISDDHGDGGGDDAEYGHVVDGHSHQPTVVDLFNLPLVRSCWLT